MCAEVKANYPEMRKRAKTMPAGIDFRVNMVSAIETPEEERRRQYQERWDYGGLGFMASFSDLLLNDESNKTAADFVREKVREIVKDPEDGGDPDADQHHRLQAAVRRQRLLGDLQPAERHAGRYPRRADRAHHARPACAPRGRTTAFDCLVLATGFDAMTGALLKVDIRGRGGVALKEKWGEGPKTYLGLTVVGFPNLFTITGPGSPSVLTNMLPSIEQHVDWIADCLEALRAKGVAVIEPVEEAQEAWNVHVGSVANITLRSTCSSWYVGANIPASRGCSCPISAACRPTSSAARRSWRTATRASRWPSHSSTSPARGRGRVRELRRRSPHLTSPLAGERNRIC